MKPRSLLRLAVAVTALGALAFGPVADLLTTDGKAQALADGTLDTSTSVPVTTQADCVDGQAGPYACEDMDLLSIVSIPEIGLGTVSDMWGWTDPATGQEWALITTGIGLAFVDVTTPTEPVVAARMPIQPTDYAELWRDVKVYDDHAYVVSEHGGFGMQIFDLARLRDLSGAAPGNATTVSPDAIYDGFGNAHNVAINEDTGFAYAVGTGGDECNSGLHMMDLSDPKAPAFAGCFADDGYTHDVQCVVYDGPDADHQGSEICFASNEDTVTIVDVTDKANPVQLSRVGYPEAAYTHQGWLTPGQDWFIFGDELDEQEGTVGGTATYIMDVSDLDAPPTPEPFIHETSSIDHNMYVVDDFVYQANYMAGLRVMRWTDAGLAAGQLEQVAYLDTVPVGDVAEFAGVWTLYPFFESGTLVASDFNTGLIVARLDDSLRPPPTPEPIEGAKAMGAGELEGDDAEYEVRFRTNGTIKPGKGEPKAKLVLDGEDDGPAVRIAEFTAIGEPTAACQDVAAAGGESLELHGDGTFDGADASFRVCIADVSKEKGDDSEDRFVLECTSGCDFTTRGTTADDRIDGRIKVKNGATHDGETGPSDPEEDDDPGVVMVGPVETTGDLGTVETTVYGNDMLPLAGATVTLDLPTVGGSVGSLVGVTGPGGTLTFTVDPTGLVDPRASAGDVRSN